MGTVRLVKSENFNENYAAKIVYIGYFKPHSNPEVTKMKCCTVDGFNIITSINDQPGYYVYFPTLCEINPKILWFLNLYSNKDLNRDRGIAGFFSNKGIVKAIKLKGEISEGFILPISEFEAVHWHIAGNGDYVYYNYKNIDEFDSIIDYKNEEVWICRKYVPHVQEKVYSEKSKRNSRFKVPKRLDRIRRDQFRFHYDTILLRKHPYLISPNNILHISHKLHGTSGISARVLCHQKLNWKQKIAKWLTGEKFDIYDYIYASRKIIRNQYYNPEFKDKFNDTSVYYHADQLVRPHLKCGETAYYEILGYTPKGSYIQKEYDYRCIRPTNGEYLPEKHFKVRIYRVTYTNPEGDVYEFTPTQVHKWCIDNNLEPVPQWYYGAAKDLYPELLDKDCDWNLEFVETLANDKTFFMECYSPHCLNKVPHEGLVIKIENEGKIYATKLKCFAFINREQKELEQGETNIEDNQ